MENSSKKLHKTIDTRRGNWDSQLTHGNKNKTMRTKTTLAAAAILAAGLASSMAQNVYSLNVVGYVNVNYKAGFNAAANPLVGSPDNTLNTVLSGANVPDNTTLFTWDTTLQDFSPVLPVYVASSGTWSVNSTIAQGQGIFLLAPADFTHTFVGEVKQGSTTTQIVPGFNAIASPVPIGGNLATVLAQLTPTDNDNAFQWNTTTQDFGTISTYVASSSSWSPAGNFAVGEGIFYLAAAPITWVRTFTVQP